VMLTGDNPGSAARVASQLGIDVVKAGLLPEQKVQAIRGLQSQGHVVAMVGDGVNDAPALAVADVSIAMGASGTQAAIETADIALMADRLERVPYSIRLSGDILKIVRQNVVFAVAVVVLLLAGVIGRVIFLSSGMLVHEASILLVIANGMRLLRPDE
ncbi:MAG: HAD-IC family P-type ATPase, partial [Bacillota bacterium]